MAKGFRKKKVNSVNLGSYRFVYKSRCKTRKPVPAFKAIGRVSDIVFVC